MILAGTADNKLRLGGELGADLTVNVLTRDLKQVVDEVTGGIGADFVMEASGNVKAMQQAVDVAAMGATISVVGLHETPIPQLDMGNIVVRDLNLITSVASPNAFKPTLRLMERGKIRVKPLITHEFPLSDAPAALELQEKRPGERIKIQLSPDN